MAEAKRKLAAILSADVAGYSRLMQDDEAATVETLTKYREIFHDLVTRHDGRIVDSPGDNILAEFASPVEAVQSAIDIQRELGWRNRQLADHRQMHFRIGVNLGDVIEKEDGSIYGSGVNIAARLESLAEPGSTMISEDVRRQVLGKMETDFEDAGAHDVKNIAKPVQAYHIAGRDAAATPSATKKPLALPDKPSIAVLPFANLSGDPEQEYFADGIAEDLITALSRLRWLFVVARNSSFTFKGRAVNVTQVGRDIGVRYVVEGSVRRGGQRVRVSVQLIDATNGNHIWAERYDRALDDLFALQDEITETVAAAIAPELEAVERARARRKPPGSLDAWEAYQRGMWHLFRFTCDDNLAAMKLFNDAIARDGDFASAHAALAHAHVVAAVLDYPDFDLDVGLAAARRAVGLDDRDAIAHFALGRILSLRHDLDAAIDEIKEALQISPSFPFVRFALGWTYLMAGQCQEAIRETDLAERQSPRDPVLWAMDWVRSMAHAISGDFVTALDYARKSAKRPNAPFWVQVSLACAAVNAGSDAEASSALTELRRTKPNFDLRLVDRIFGRSKVTDYVRDGLTKAAFGPNVGKPA